MAANSSATPAWSSVKLAESEPMPTAENPGIFPVQHYSYSSSDAVYEEETKDPNSVESLKSGKDTSREAGAGVKALSLLEEAALAPQEMNDPNSVESLKSGKASSREAVAGVKALSLLDDAFGKEAAPAPPETGYHESGSSDVNAEPRNLARVQDFKRSADLRRECGASTRALYLLDEAVTGQKPEKPLSARQAAIQRYEQQKKEMSNTKTEAPVETKHIPTTGVVPQRMECLAVTTRARKPPTPEDVRDPETVAGMKCKLDWDREKEAQAKALKLLSLLG